MNNIDIRDLNSNIIWGANFVQNLIRFCTNLISSTANLDEAKKVRYTNSMQIFAWTLDLALGDQSIKMAARRFCVSVLCASLGPYEVCLWAALVYELCPSRAQVHSRQSACIADSIGTLVRFFVRLALRAWLGLQNCWFHQSIPQTTKRIWNYSTSSIIPISTIKLEFSSDKRITTNRFAWQLKIVN